MKYGHTPRPHEDSGLQPERTILAWARTTVSFFVAAAIFLRWLPHYGPQLGVLVILAAAAAIAIYASQRRRYAEQARGLSRQAIRADVSAVFWMTAVVVLVGIAGVWIVVAETPTV